MSKAVTFLKTPLGYMKAVINNDKVRSLLFLEQEINHENQGKWETFKYGLMDQLTKELSAYFEGKLQEFSVPFEEQGTEFQKKVWNEVLQIPFGSFITYKTLASKLDTPDAVRAVAGANATNPVAILIPCHRVIGSNGNLTGYRGGLWRKRKLLRLETRELELFPAY